MPSNFFNVVKFLFFQCYKIKEFLNRIFKASENFRTIFANNIIITIGGLQNGTFIATDSYTFPTILVLPSNSSNSENNAQTFAFYEDRWNPDLAEVKVISDKAYFTIQLEGEDPVLFSSKRLKPCNLLQLL